MVFCLDENVLHSMLGTYTNVGVILLLYVSIYVTVVLITYVNLVVMSLIYERGVKLVFCKLLV